jgi:uncharacterized protein (TIGR01777 family)
MEKERDAIRIFVTGGTGFVGTALIQSLAEHDYEITVLTRAVRENFVLPKGVRLLEGNPTESGPWQDKVAEHDIIINLAGATIFKRWTRKTKQSIRDSRILTTRNLVDALGARKGEQTLLLNTSAVGYYGFHEDEELHEGSPPGYDFLASVVQDWETSALKAEKLGVRVLLCRFGIVLGPGGGALSKMVKPFQWYLGSPLGNGRQWFSWIHNRDLVNIFLFLLEQENISGPINCTAPFPVTNRELTQVLGEVMRKPTFMPAIPRFMIKFLMGEFGSILVKGQKVLPNKLLEMGFHFEFSKINEALEDLLRNQ